MQIKGIGSGFVDQETGREADEPMYIHVTFVSQFCAPSLPELTWHISGPDEQQVARAKALTEDLLEVVHAEHGKVKAVVQQQQMELHQAQLQYAAYSAYVCITLLIRSSPSSLRLSSRRSCFSYLFLVRMIPLVAD